MSVGHQIFYFNRPEPIYFQFYDSDGDLVNVSTPRIDIYTPDQTKIINSSALTNESTGTYYYIWSVSTSLSTALGLYQAWASGYSSNVLITMDEPRYLDVRQIPMGTGYDDQFLQSVRRFIGDNDATSYRVPTGDLAGFIEDSIEALNAKIRKYQNTGMGLTVTADVQGVTFSTTPTSSQAHLIKLQVVLLLQNYYLNISASQPGIISAGDTKINVTQQMQILNKIIDRQQYELEKEIVSVIRSGVAGIRINTTGDGTGNDYLSIWWR